MNRGLDVIAEIAYVIAVTLIAALLVSLLFWGSTSQEEEPTCPPGQVEAEDRTCVPESYWDDQKEGTP